jgi:hypothetical protein
VTLTTLPNKVIDGKIRYQCAYCSKWLAICTVTRHVTGKCPDHPENKED